MAILALFTGDGSLTPDLYDKLRADIRWDGMTMGGVVHIASFDDKGIIHVADLWNSEEEMKTFAETHLMPALQKMNIPPPHVEVYPVHNVDVFSEIDAYKK